MAFRFTDKDIPDQSGQTILVTGANAGLGYETAKALAGKGARVLLGCRSADRANTAIKNIQKIHANADLAFIPLDQADLSSVKTAAKLVKKEPRLDALINNAGIMGPPLEYTEDGFESQFGVNHLGTFALTSHLLKKLEKTGNGRIVITSSIAHKNAKIYFDDINAERSYMSFARYAQSKLANLLHMYELDRRLRATGSSISVMACHPGVAATELVRNLPELAQAMVPLFSLVLNDSANGAWPTLAAATAHEAQSGQYFGPSGLMEVKGPARIVRSTTQARDPELAKRLWDLSIEMTGVNPKIGTKKASKN